MNIPEDASRREEFEAALNELVARDWLASWTIRDGQYAVTWTVKGYERRHWLRVIDAELGAGERAMTNVLAICCCTSDPNEN